MRQVIPDEHVDELCDIAHELLPKIPGLLATRTRDYARRLVDVVENCEGNREREYALGVVFLHALALTKHCEIAQEDLRQLIGSWDSNLDVSAAFRNGRIQDVRDRAGKLQDAILSPNDANAHRELWRLLKAIMGALEALEVSVLGLHLAVGRVYQGYWRNR